MIGFTVGHYLFTNYLALRQYRVLSRPKPPAELADVITDETFEKTKEYGRAKARFGFVDSFYSLIQSLAIIHFDVLPKFYGASASFCAKWAPVWAQGSISTSIVFFFGLQLISIVTDLPSSLYGTFVLEEKFGFNKQTPKLFFTDMVKSFGLALAIGGPVLAAVLKIIDYFGKNFFLYLWIFVMAFQVVFQTIYPTVIQPLFNTLTPLEDGELKTSIEKLAASVNFPLTKLYVIDGSKRSSHSNAYFSGFPWSKHIVIFDTLIEKSTVNEVTGVLAHEIGHWAMSHTTRMFVFIQLHLFEVFALFSAFIANKSLYSSFGFHNEMPILVGWVLFSDIFTPVDSLFMFLFNMMSRKHEYEADHYAYDLGFGDDLAKSLVGLHVENLSTVDADSWYSTYHHSHPILPERLKALKSFKVKKQ